MSSGTDRPPPDDEDPLEPLEGVNSEEGPAQVGTFLGALGQMAAAALIVLAVLALFIAGAVVFRWTFH